MFGNHDRNIQFLGQNILSIRFHFLSPSLSLSDMFIITYHYYQRWYGRMKSFSSCIWPRIPRPTESRCPKHPVEETVCHLQRNTKVMARHGKPWWMGVPSRTKFGRRWGGLWGGTGTGGCNTEQRLIPCSSSSASSSTSFAAPRSYGLPTALISASLTILLNTMMQVHQRKPATIEKLREIVGTIPEEMVRDAIANLRKRYQACKAAACGHFESFLKQF